MKNRTQMKIHPVAEMFPMIQEGTIQWNDLKESISRNGQIDPIVFDGEVLLDGRNRFAVCESLGIKPKSVQWSDLKLSMPIHEWIFTRNFDRRHMTDDQKVATHAQYIAWEAAHEGEENKKAAQFKPDNKANPTGSNQHKRTVNTDSCSPSRDTKAMRANSTVGKVAKAAGVSHHKAAQAVAVVKAAKDSPGAAKVLEGVKAGIVPLKDAFASVKPQIVKPRNDSPEWAGVWKLFKRLGLPDQIAFLAHLENHWTKEEGVIEQ